MGIVLLNMLCEGVTDTEDVPVMLGDDVTDADDVAVSLGDDVTDTDDVPVVLGDDVTDTDDVVVSLGDDVRDTDHVPVVSLYMWCDEADMGSLSKGTDFFVREDGRMWLYERPGKLSRVLCELQELEPSRQTCLVLGLANLRISDTFEFVNGRPHGRDQAVLCYCRRRDSWEEEECRVSFCNGRLHSYNDRAAYEDTYVRKWFRHGSRHREGGMPARVGKVPGTGQGTEKARDPRFPWWLYVAVSADGFLGPGDNDGFLEWWEQDARHRAEDKPAVVQRNGNREWWIHGSRHRAGDKPAVLKPDGTREWWVHGFLHRGSGKPAIVCLDGSREWWTHGLRHRGGDKPAIVREDGSCEWWRDGVRHREGDELAVVNADGSREWWKHGWRHREGHKPAVVHEDGVDDLWEDGVMVLTLTQSFNLLGVKV